MKKIIAVVLIVGLVSGGIAIPVYASDWDKAGKVFAIIEGVRVLTGGNVDVIGTITGINRPKTTYVHHTGGRSHYARAKKHHHSDDCWVSHYIWKKKYISEHREYDERYGEIIVEGHYIEYKVQDGGRWGCGYD
ncbi:MAG: hypothetical protein ABH954_03540 [Candidatus Omnitrophota bacterium]